MRDDHAVGDGERLVLAVDVGGTDVKAEVMAEDLGVRGSGTAPATRGDGDATLATVIALARQVLSRLSPTDLRAVEAVGLAVPGIVDPAAGRAVLATNLGWRDAQVASPVAAALGLPVVLTHDVTAAGVAELRRGAARGARDALVVVIGTGIAGVLVVDGRVVRGGLRQAGELGHIVVRPGGPVCGCGAAGCLEAVASASAISRAYARATGTADAGARAVHDRLGHDPVADAVWADAVEALADGVMTVAALLSPTLVVVGGGLAEAGDALLDPLRAAMSVRARVAAAPHVVPAVLGARAGLVGSALAAWDHVLPAT